MRKNSTLFITVVGALLCTILSGLFYLSSPKKVQQTAILNQPTQHFVENIGVTISSDANLGKTHFSLSKEEPIINDQKTIKKVVNIQPEKDENLNADFVFHYEEQDLNGLDESKLVLYSSTDKGKSWDAHPNSVVNVDANTIHLEGVGHFSLWTAAPLPPEPGCITTNLSAWFKADIDVYSDAGSTLATDGEDNVQEWHDQSGNTAFSSNQPEQTTAGNKPSFIANGVNFNPVLEFEGAGDRLRTSSQFNADLIRDVNGEQASVYVVANTDNTASNVYFDHGGTGTSDFFVATGGAAFGQSSILNYTADVGDAGDQFQLISGVRAGTDELNVFLDGAANGTNTDNDAAGINDFFFIGINDNLGEALEGDIAEIIIYREGHNQATREQIQSYLGIKYGITLPHSYLSGTGTTIWTNGGGYDNNIASIGREDCQELDQRQSISVESDAVVSIYNGDQSGDLPATNALNASAFSADASYLVWGQNGMSTNYTTPYAPAAPYVVEGTYGLMERVWLLQETGTVTDVTVQAPNNATHLLVHDNPNFTTGTPTEILLSDDNNGNKVAVVDFTDGQYFTFGADIVAPGCVTNNLVAWYKFDDVTLNATQVSAIADASGNGYSLSSSATANQPDFSETALNFNPGGFFDGTNDFLRNQYPDFVSTTDPISLISVSIPTIFGGERRTIAIGDLSELPGLGHQGSRMEFKNLGAGTPDNTHSATQTVNTPYIMIGTANNDSPEDVRISFNGVTNEESSNAANGTFSAGQGGNIALGNEPITNNDDYAGTITEAIIYNKALGQDEKERIYSYLAVKYGITLNQNYYAGDWNGVTGTTLWDITTNATYSNDIAGIGIDSCQALVQKQSMSVNSTAIMTVGLDSIMTSNAAHGSSFTMDESYLLWGHDGASTAAISFADPCAAMVDARSERIWRFQPTGTSENVQVQIPSLAGLDTQRPIYMLISDATTFTDYISVPMTYDDIAMEHAANYTFESTKFVTFAGSAPLAMGAYCDGNKYIDWRTEGWANGTTTKMVTQGTQEFTFTFEDPDNVAYRPTIFPRRRGRTVEMRRRDNDDAAVTTFRMTSNEVMEGVFFTLFNMDGRWHKESVEINGYLNGSLVAPNLSVTTNSFTDLTSTNTATSTRPRGYYNRRVQLFVDFNTLVDEFEINFTVDHFKGRRAHRILGIGDIEVVCPLPPPPCTIQEGIYISKAAPAGTIYEQDTFNYTLAIQNLSCTDQTISINDTLPAGVTWADSSIVSSLTGYTTNMYGGGQILEISNLTVPAGTTYLRIGATSSTDGTYDNQAFYTIDGNTYPSYNAGQDTSCTSVTPVIIQDTPFPIADISLTKSASVNQLNAGDTMTYTVAFQNNEASSVTVDFEDILPGVLTIVENSLVNSNGGTVQAYVDESDLVIDDMVIPVGASSLSFDVFAVSNCDDDEALNIAEVTPTATSGFMDFTTESNQVSTDIIGLENGAAPVLSATSASNVCPVTTVDLTALVISIAPTGTSIVWSTDADASDGLSSTEATPEAVSMDGTYYAYFFDINLNCFSPVSQGVVVTIDNCSGSNADLTPSVFIDQQTFTPSQSRDFVVSIQEINGDDSDGTILRFTIPKIANFDITFSPTATSADYLGGTPVQNADWDVVDNGTTLICTYTGNVGVFLASSSSEIGFNITRQASAQTGVLSSINVTIPSTDGGDVNANNNQAVLSISASN